MLSWDSSEALLGLHKGQQDSLALVQSGTYWQCAAIMRAACSLHASLALALLLCRCGRAGHCRLSDRACGMLWGCSSVLTLQHDWHPNLCPAGQ